MTYRPQPRANLSIEEVQRLLHYMPLLVKSDLVDDFERRFCASVISASRKGPWHPSVKQAPIMQRLVDRFLEQLGGEVVE